MQLILSQHVYCGEDGQGRYASLQSAAQPQALMILSQNAQHTHLHHNAKSRTAWAYRPRVDESSTITNFTEGALKNESDLTTCHPAR